jgi:methylene-tetrahydromethanopterin dehydrogenase
MLFLDTDKHATLFDILMAYDCGFDVVVPYQQVEVEDAVRIVQDAMFSRGTKGVKSTTIFIAGTDVEKTRKILKKVKKVMFPPFELSVVFDPRGGHTTASALVVKVEEALSKHRLGTLQGKKVVILAGTGQVGRLAARICSSRGAEVSITSRQKARADKIAREIEAETGSKVRGLQAATLEETYESVKDAGIIISAGKAGVITLPMSVLRKLERGKILADVNAIPPLGIEGVTLKADNEEVLPGVYGIGALSIGDLKYKIEARILNEVRTTRGGLFDYKFAFEKGKELLERSPPGP